MIKDVREIIESLNNSPHPERSRRAGDEGKDSIYFLGIGGIGMSALARYFNEKGITVSGYDKTETPLTKQLISEGIAVHFKDDIGLIDKAAKLVVYTPAVPKDHSELNYYLDNNYTVVKRSDVLGAVTNSSFNICIAGTHGKTTTSTMVAHILRHSGYGCTAFLGGIAVNYNNNYWSEGNDKNVCVAEADEYDRSFLKLSPDIAIISSMDPDHLDIYGTAENMEQAFIEFAGKIKSGGLLLSKFGLKRNADLKAERHLTYHLDNVRADVYAADIKMENGTYRFDVWKEDWKLNNVVLNMGGMHNIENAIAAITVAHQLGIEDEKIKMAVEDFKGVKRRFEYIVKDGATVYIDDYAHHPDELKALITGAKELFPEMNCVVIFQPHLYSRTRDFVDGFASSLNLADDVWLLPIYPARELPIEGVTSKMILDKMHEGHGHLYESKEEMMDFLKYAYEHGRESFFITAGAGDIDTLVDPIKKILTTEGSGK